MTLSRRISLVVSATIALTSFAIAVLAAFAGRAAAIDQVDERLIELREASSRSDDPVAFLLTEIGAVPSDLVAYLAVDDSEVLSLLDVSIDASRRLSTAISTADLTELVQSPGTLNGDFATRAIATDLGNGQTLVIGEPIDDITRNFKRQLLTNLLLAILIALLGGGVSSAMTRRALRPLRRIVAYSGEIAKGALHTDLEHDSSAHEIRELQSSITEMVDSLRQSVETKSRSEADMRVFLADVAHELRTPLTTVRAYADLLASDESVAPEIRSRARERISHESRRMSRLIDDLLLLARLASTSLGSMSRVDIGSLMSSHFSDLRVLDPGRSVELHCDACFVDGDPSLLERVFANLASNVHRHTPESARVMASCKTQNDAVQCVIEDAGPGLDDRQVRQLAAGTERFGYLGSGDRHGTGLGLFLVASIIRSHGGTASFTRGDLGGLRVSLTLPSHHSVP